KNWIEGVIIIESVSPHGRPEIISFQAKKQLKNFFINKMIDATEFFFGPSGKSRGFIIDKNATVFYGRRSKFVNAFLHIYFGLLFYRNISPPIPGGNTQLFG